MNQPLKGVKVVDFTAYGAGPAAARMLADWGADVIKIEPLGGEPSRLTGETLGMRADAEQNPLWEMLNGNKRSLPLNLKSEEGKKVLDGLLKTANIFLSNYRMKALSKMGLDYETMSAKHPHIIWGVLTGFGLEGPAADDPGFDTVAFWARSGAMIDFCENGEVPLTPPFGLGDMGTASTFAGALGSCLYQQAKTGKGEKVIISLYAQALWDESCVIPAIHHGNVFPKSRKNPDSPLRNTFKCKDGTWMMVSVIVYDRYFPVMCKVIGREDLIDDPRFNTEAAVQSGDNSRIFTDILDPIFLTKDFEEWHQILSDADVAHDKINHMSDTLTDIQAKENNFIYTYKNRDGTDDIMVSTPVKYGVSGPTPHRNAPLLGEHTDEVLTELGLSADQIKQLIDTGVTERLV